MDNRKNFIDHKRIIIKIGTTTLTYPNGKLNLKRIRKLAVTLTDLRNQGKEVILISSGAIAVGADRLGLAERPRETVGKQAASAVGQGILMQIYESFFSEYNQKIAQILLTKDVIEDENRKTNARNTFEALLSLGVIPIVNENDTVSVDELGFSDNDTLSAHVACLTGGDVLIILSDIDGMYDCDPKLNPKAKLISLITDITDEIQSFGGDSSSDLGTGGMASKIIAAKMAGASAIDTVVALGSDPDILFEIMDGKEVGTLFKGKLQNKGN